VKAAQEIDDQGNAEDQPDTASAKGCTTEIEATTPEQEQEHNENNDRVHHLQPSPARSPWLWGISLPSERF